MWLKFAGGVMIVFAAVGIGFSKALRYKIRPKHIRQLINCLTSLKTYINYKAMPLPEALRVCTGELTSPVGKMFLQVAAELEEKGWLMPSEAIKNAMDHLDEELMLQAPEREVLEFFAANLGQVNLQEQQHVFEIVTAELKEIEQQAADDSLKNVKMYRYLGICGGLALVIILI